MAIGRFSSLGVTILLVTSFLAATPGLAGAQPMRSGVCAGVPGCRVTSHADVNGDGHRDAVGIASRGHRADREVIVRVRLAGGRTVTARHAAPYWTGSLWQGVAPLDGCPGKEIVVGQTMGAHAQLYRALTWRAGGLHNLNAPGEGRYWMIDGAYSIMFGWQSVTEAAAGTIRRRLAERVSTSGAKPFRGKALTYQWTTRGWREISSNTLPHMSVRRASSWGGFYVPGLPRW